MAVSLHWGDYLSLMGYFVVVIGFGIWSSCKNRGSVRGYFLAGRSMHWMPIGASIFASNIGSGHFIGLAGSGLSSGVAVSAYEILAPVSLFILAYFFLPIYIRSGVYTMPQYLNKRFGGDRIRITLTIVSLVAYIFTKISVDLFSGALFIKLSLDLNLYASIGILIVISAFFTIGGGLSAVIWTDFIQIIIMIIGAFYLMVTAFVKVGGFSEMKLKYGYSVAQTTLFSNSTCGLPPKDYLDIMRAPSSDLPWAGFIFGLTIIAIWYFCSDQVIVQRALAAKNITHAKAGCIFAGFLKFIPLFLMVYPGMIARVLYKDDVSCADPTVCQEYCGNPYGCSNVAYPRMVIDLMPVGARGLMLAVMMAALMSSLTSVFNSSSTIFTMDIYKRFRVKAKDWELMVVGRLFVVLLLILSILSIPLIQSSKDSRLFDYLNAIQSIMAPPISAMFCMAISFKRVNEKGAFWGLISGFTFGVVKFVWFSLYETPYCGMDLTHMKKPPPIINMHFLHFAIVIFVFTCSVTYFISIFTRPLPYEYIRGLVYSTLNDLNQPREIPHSKGCGASGFCAAADLDGSMDDELEPVNEKDRQEEENFSVLIHKKVGIFKKILLYICGIEREDQNEKNPISYVPSTISVFDEDPFWSKVCDAFAVFMIMLIGFQCAFLNHY